MKGKKKKAEKILVNIEGEGLTETSLEAAKKGGNYFSNSSKKRQIARR